MKLNKKVIESAALFLFAVILTITAVTNSGITVEQVATDAADETVLANTSLENDGTAGVTATLTNYQEISVETLDTDILSTSEDVTEDVTEDDTDEDAVIGDGWREQLEANWSDKLMAKVDESLNVRAEANSESELVGKLRKGDRALILEEGETWTKIESGKVIGYVNNDFCVTGSEALAYANEICELVATVKIDGLRVRSDYNEDATVLTKVDEGDTLLVDKNANKTEGWIAVRYNGQKAYVSDEYVSVAYKTGKAITKEAEEAAKKAEAEKKAAEEAAKKAEAEKKYQAYLEAKEAAKKAASKSSSSSSKKTSSSSSSSKKTISSSSSSSSSGTKTQGAAVAASTDDVTLLASLIYCEAGNCSYEGQLAVGAVVMNRVKSKTYPNTISAVIYQKGQFSPAKSGRLAKVIAKGPSATAIKAAKEAISGVDNTNGAIGFKFASSGKKGVVYGKVVFFK